MNPHEYPKELELKYKVAAPISQDNQKTFAELLKVHKISPEEFEHILAAVGRVPSLCELGVFSAMWSEHCSYKSSRVHLKRFPTTGENVMVGPGENAGIVRLEGPLGVTFKMESHNHPSYIEPYQGAATGVGGILRDVFCMGARPVANINCLRFGEKSHPRTAYLLENVVRGIGDYGNCIGVATVGGNISFDKSYNGNCLVNAMSVGLILEDDIFKGYASGLGNFVVYAGSATGRDGIHGATMASDSFQSKEQGERSTVQVGDPFTQKLLLEATLEALKKKLVVGLQDMGAAGLTSSSFEMASRAQSGLYINLDLVPVRAQNMSAYELLLSESQERMLLVVTPQNWPALKDVFEHWEIAHAIIGVVTDTKRVQITYQGSLEVNLPVDPITNEAPRYDRPQKRPQQTGTINDWSSLEALARKKGFSEVLCAMLAQSGDKKPIFEQYDRHIGRRSRFESGQQGASVLAVSSYEGYICKNKNLGLAISSACAEGYCAVSSKDGAEHAVWKAARMMYCQGAEPLAITDCLNFGNPEQAEVMAQISDAVDGITKACRELNVPVVSGNVSLYNQTDGVSIAPTPMIGMVGRVDDIRLARPAVQLKEAIIYLLTPKKEAEAMFFGGSLFVRQWLDRAEQFSFLPVKKDWEIEAASFIKAGLKYFSAIRDIGEGGLANSLSKFILDSRLGFQSQRGDFGFAQLFAERHASYLIAIEEESIGEAEFLGKNTSLTHLNLVKLGVLSAKHKSIQLGELVIELSEAQDAFAGAYKL